MSEDELQMSQYVDRLKVTIFEAESPISTQPEDAWIVTGHGIKVDTTWLEREIERFLQTFPGEYPPYSAVTVTRKSTNWGASGAQIEAIVTLAGGIGIGVLGNAAYDLIKKFMARIGERVFDERDNINFDQSEADRVARGLIYNRHSVPPDLLSLTGVDVGFADGVTKLEFVDNNKYTYVVEMFADPTGIVATRMSRKTPPDPVL